MHAQQSRDCSHHAAGCNSLAVARATLRTPHSFHRASDRRQAETCPAPPCEKQLRCRPPRRRRRHVRNALISVGCTSVVGGAATALLLRSPDTAAAVAEAARTYAGHTAQALAHTGVGMVSTAAVSLLLHAGSAGLSSAQLCDPACSHLDLPEVCVQVLQGSQNPDTCAMAEAPHLAAGPPWQLLWLSLCATGKHGNPLIHLGLWARDPVCELPLLCACVMRFCRGGRETCWDARG